MCKLEESTPLASGQLFFLQRKGPLLGQMCLLLAVGLGSRALAVGQALEPQLLTPMQDPDCPSVRISPKPYWSSPPKCSELSRNWISPGNDMY